MSIHEIEMQKPKIRRIPREVIEQREDTMRRNRLSLLKLLIEAHPEEAQIIIDGLKSSCKPQAIVV